MITYCKLMFMLLHKTLVPIYFECRQRKIFKTFLWHLKPTIIKLLTTIVINLSLLFFWFNRARERILIMRASFFCLELSRYTFHKDSHLEYMNNVSHKARSITAYLKRNVAGYNTRNCPLSIPLTFNELPTDSKYY